MWPKQILHSLTTNWNTWTGVSNGLFFTCLVEHLCRMGCSPFDHGFLGEDGTTHCSITLGTAYKTTWRQNAEYRSSQEHLLLPTEKVCGLSYWRVLSIPCLSRYHAQTSLG
jgi:hypothetical protein